MWISLNPLYSLSIHSGSISPFTDQLPPSPSPSLPEIIKSYTHASLSAAIGEL